MKKKQNIFIICIILVLIIILSIIKTHKTKEQINLQIINIVNSTDILNTNITHTNPDLKLLNSIDNNTQDTYNVNVNDILNGKLKKIVIENSIYYKYTFTAFIGLEKNNQENIFRINSSVILEKKDKFYDIKSLDDFKQDVSKEILKIKNKNSEDISKELNDISLIYRNEKLDVNINYPEYYSYTSVPMNNNNTITDTISFYMTNEKTVNYVLISMSNSKDISIEEYIETLLKQNYTLEEDLFTTPQGLNFKVLTQNFKQNSSEIIEKIYLLDNSYKNLNTVNITVKIDSKNQKRKLTEAEEIIKSIT